MNKQKDKYRLLLSRIKPEVRWILLFFHADDVPTFAKGMIYTLDGGSAFEYFIGRVEPMDLK